MFNSNYAKAATTFFRHLATQTPTLVGGLIKVHTWTPLDKASFKTISISNALIKSRFSENKALVGHASLELIPTIAINPHEITHFQELLSQKHLNPLATQYLQTIAKHSENKYPLYLSMWAGDEIDDAHNSDITFKPGQNNMSLEIDKKEQLNREPRTIILPISESEMRKAYDKTFKTIWDSLQHPPQLTWGLFDNCAHYVFDTLHAAGVVKTSRPMILTPEKLHDIVVSVKAKREKQQSETLDL